MLQDSLLLNYSDLLLSLQERIQDFFVKRGCTRLLLYFNTNKPHSLFFGRIPVVLENRRSSRGVRTPCTLPLDPPLHSYTFKNKNFDFKSFYSAFRLLFIVPVWSCIGWSVKQVAKVMEKSQKYWFSVFYSVFCITFKVLLLTFKALNNLAPPYLSQLIVPYNPTRNLRSASKHLLEVPSVRLKSYGDRAFSVAAPKHWNDIPLDIKLSGSVDVFKSRLKTYLFRLAFSWLFVLVLLLVIFFFDCKAI